MKKILFWDDIQSMPAITSSLQRGHVLAGSSDTVLGLLADASRDGFLALNRIKGRVQKPYVVLISDANKLNSFVQMPLDPVVQKLVDQCWPGPLTMIFKSKVSLPPHLQSPEGTIALRVPQHTGLLTILPHFNGLFSTSANKAGDPVALTVDELHEDVVREIEYIVVDRAAQESTTPSTIIDCSGHEIRLVRAGAYPFSLLEKIISS